MRPGTQLEPVSLTPGPPPAEPPRPVTHRPRRLVAATAAVAVVAVGLLAVWVAPRIGLTRGQWLLLAHSGSGILLVHAAAGGLGALLATTGSRTREWARRLSVLALAGGAWVAVLVGTWAGYPQYLATPPAGADLAAYPRAWLTAHPHLAWWNTAMTWKVWLGWLAPPLLTAATVCVLAYRSHLAADPALRHLVRLLLGVGVAAALAAAGIGVAVNIAAPNTYLR